MWPGRQVHLGRWFLVLHSALRPHLSNGHGSWHSLSMQAWVNGHSESLLHPAKENEECPFLVILYRRFQVLIDLLSDLCNINLTFFTKRVGISYISRKTNTNGSMIFCSTFGILAARMSIARILTFFLYTCKVVRTFRINNTFRFWCWNMSCVYNYHAN